MSDEEWGAFASEIRSPGLPLGSGTVASPAPSKALVMLVEALLDADAALDITSERVKNLREEIASHLHLTTDAVGEEVEIDTGDYKVKASRGERWTWDQKGLSEIVDLDPEEAGEVVEVRYSIPRKVYERLTEAEQETFAPALTRKPGTLSVKIERK